MRGDRLVIITVADETSRLIRYATFIDAESVSTPLAALIATSSLASFRTRDACKVLIESAQAQGASWGEIADALGESVAAAKRRLSR